MQVFKHKARKSLKELVRVLISAVGTWVDILLKEAPYSFLKCRKHTFQIQNIVH